MDNQHDQSNDRDNNTNNQSKPQNNQSVLVQNILGQLTDEFMPVSVRGFDVLGRSVDLTVSERWKKHVS